ncbi:MAG: thioredoxin family protein [Cytophagales bacterium]|nr:thioredoxin family protein [Cytophagales bacterium]
MKKFVFVLFCLVKVVVWGQNSIPFEKGGFAEVQAKAKLEEKYVLLDFYTSWCGFCKKMEKTTFVDEQVVTFVKQHFVSTKLDAEKPEGEELAKKYKVRGFPTVVILDKKGKLVGKAEGYHTALDFVDELAYIIGVELDDELPDLSGYWKEKATHQANLAMKLHLKKPPEQIEAEEKAFLYGKTRNLFEFDELVYALEEKGVDYIPSIKLNFWKGQEDPKKMKVYINELLKQQKISTDELHYYVLFFAQKDLVDLDVLKWANQVARENQNLASNDTKSIVQYLYGDFRDCKGTLKKIKKTAKKEKLEIPKSSIFLIDFIGL